MAVTIDGSAGVTTNAGGSVNPSTNVDGINYSCRAWVNFDGTKDTTGATSTANTNRLIRASGNVTSVLRNGLGDYTVTFTTAMTDANYAVSATADRLTSGTNGGIFNVLTSTAPTTSAVRLITYQISVGVYDPTYAHVAIFR